LLLCVTNSLLYLWFTFVESGPENSYNSYIKRRYSCIW